MSESTFDPRHKSRALLEGPDRAVARSMMKAVGFKDDDLRRPQVGVAHCWIGTMPCNWNHRELAAKVMEGIREAGARRSKSTRSPSTTPSPPAPRA